MMTRATAAAATVLVAVAAAALDLTLVAGASMEPALHVGDVVVSAPWFEPSTGDVVVFDTGGGGRIVHRVVHVRPDGALVTRGDANHHADLDGVRPRHVRGVAVAVLPFGRLLGR